jgi:hypothetical protein
MAIVFSCDVCLHPTPHTQRVKTRAAVMRNNVAHDFERSCVLVQCSEPILWSVLYKDYFMLLLTSDD